MDRPDQKQESVAIVHDPDRQNDPSPTQEIYSILGCSPTCDTTTAQRSLRLHHGASSDCDSARAPVSPNFSHTVIRDPISRGQTTPDSLAHEHLKQDGSPNPFSTFLNLLQATPMSLMVQEENEKAPILAYSTNTQGEVMVALLESKNNKAHMLSETQPELDIFETDMILLLQHHRPAILETTLESMIRTEPQQAALPTLSSSTNLPSTSSLPPPKNLPPSQHLTTATTSTSSSASATPTTHRHLNSILQFLKARFEGTAEAHTSLQLVRFASRFISYLTRKGLGTFYKYGSRAIAILKPLTEALLHYDTTDMPSTSDLRCSQYVEGKNVLAKETITQRTFSIDYISCLIVDNKITSFEAFQRILPTHTKIQLLKQLGYVGQNIIKTLIKIHTIKSLQEIKKEHYYQLLIDNFGISIYKPQNVSLLSSIFSSNNIAIDDFFSKFLLIHSTNITKINTFVFQGPTNTGKSLLASLLLADTKPTRIARERNKSNFHLDQLPNSTSVIFEEPIIDQTTVGTWKLLLEGAPIPTDMKHADKEIIYRLPIFTTTNQPIWNWDSSESLCDLPSGDQAPSQDG
ncbi:uncharacterized protein LOC111871565 isoform X2 [Cryptotermes secundus]|uniref:uncharacterized protein LOC111871565 isoform X2 n=1 Tax=Cryptotermes secundus TaxID=105785 RepID=UPI000CD7ABD8|nr:uncharacterized protein LOC111871565 isoform X2 [Cryptotermes secundus]